MAQDRLSEVDGKDQDASRFRVERIAVANGGELLTIWAKVIVAPETTSWPSESQVGTPTRTEEIPLISVLRDTFGDNIKENDVLREVWVHTYARPRLLQKAAALVPFLYKGVTIEPRLSLQNPPRAIINLSDTSQPVYQRLLVSGVTNALISQPLLKTSVKNYQRNISDYRRSNVFRALTVLAEYRDQPQSDLAFSESELIEMQSHLALTEKTFGGLVDKTHLVDFHEKEATSLRDTRGHNWELLRQQAEVSGLYFEPLGLSEKTITHAILWFPADTSLSKESKKSRPFAGRFLNIKNPWRDERLSRWQGYTETKYLDGENAMLSDPLDESEGPDRRAVTMIPLALYGLDFNKIPALLIDFRDSRNPHRRELSGRLINDITSDVLSISRFGNLYYFLARSAFDFVTKRRGIDINQPSRLRSAAELKLLLDFNSNIGNELRQELSKGLERLTVNPLENNGRAERSLAVAQYRALQAYALRPDGLPVRLEQERSSELTKFVHRGLEAKFLQVANIITLGHYTHRENMTTELRQRLDKERQLAYHIRLLRRIAKSSPVIEVAWDMENVLPSLRFIAENGSEKDKAAARTLGSVFYQTENTEAKDLCLSALKRIGNKEAQKEMLRIYQDANVATEWRAACAEYLLLDAPQRSRAVGMDSDRN